MDDDRIGRLVLGFRASQGAHLNAILSVYQSVLVCHLGQAQRLVSHPQTRGIHHDKHALHALVRLADHRANRIFQDHLCSGAGLDAHLVLQAATVNSVANTQRSVLVHQVFGDDEEADPLDSGGRIWQSGQHQVDDVVRHIVFTSADEYFVAGNLVRTIGLRLGLRAHQTEISTAVGLGQAHRARPFTTGHFVQIGLLLRVGAVGV